MKIVVIGAGNWGTTLSYIFSRNNEISLWAHSDEHANDINKNRENKKYLRGVRLPETIKAVKYFSEPLGDKDLIVFAVPSTQVRSVAAELAAVATDQIIICASKGFEHTTMKTMSEVINDELPASPMIVFTGPNIAREIADGKPTKAVLASKDFSAVSRAARQLKNEFITYEICSDVKGVELCAALKGIIAIGVGLADGLNLGMNFMGVLMTYGLKEFASISEFMGISAKTIYGIAGLGDLIATCLSTESRNRKFGFMLGKGISRDSALQQVGMVVEGVQMAKTIAELEDLNIPVPLFSAISKIIFEPNGHLPHKFIDSLRNYKTS